MQYKNSKKISFTACSVKKKFSGRVKQQVQFTLIVCKTQLWVC